MLLHLFPSPSIVIVTSYFGVSNSFPCFILLWAPGYFRPHHPFSFIYLPYFSDFVLPLFFLISFPLISMSSDLILQYSFYIYKTQKCIDQKR